VHQFGVVSRPASRACHPSECPTDIHPARQRCLYYLGQIVAISGCFGLRTRAVPRGAHVDVITWALVGQDVWQSHPRFARPDRNRPWARSTGRGLRLAGALFGIIQPLAKMLGPLRQCARAFKVGPCGFSKRPRLNKAQELQPRVAGLNWRAVGAMSSCAGPLPTPLASRGVAAPGAKLFCAGRCLYLRATPRWPTACGATTRAAYAEVDDPHTKASTWSRAAQGRLLHLPTSVAI